MNNFRWLGPRTIIYKGRVCELTEHDGWEVINAMRRVDREEELQREMLKKELKREMKEVIAEALAKERAKHE